LVGEALSHKESMIKVLEEQLQAERARREAVTNRFKEQIAEFENERNALERLRRASNILEKKQMERGNAS
jgi:outer membrane protein assembly factor BamD (BamD/ComL family)